MGNKTQIQVPKFKSAAELRTLLENEASTARERITALFDEGTFAETGAYAHRIAAELGGDAGELEGVICGYGAIDGRLVFAFAQDFSRMKGALGAMQARKICDLYELAIKNGAPIIGIFDSAGAYVMEGVEALAGYGKIMKKAASASGLIPQIGVVAGICGGAMAVIASMFDIVIGADKEGSLYVNPPFVLNNKDKTANIGAVQTAADNGMIDIVVADAAASMLCVRKLLSYIPQNNADGTAYASSADEINRLVDLETVVAGEAYSMVDVIKAISDDAAFAELGEAWGKSMLTGFATFNGMVVGIVANQPAVNGGKLTVSAAKKAAKFISFCDCFNIPLLTLVDTEGYEASVEGEKANYAAALAKLASAYAMSENAKVTVVLGKAYGAAYTLMGSKAIGADIAFAVDSAKISAMPTASAVAFAWNEKVTDNAKRAEVEAEWNKVMAAPIAAAKTGEIDDIIAIGELRQRTAAAFEMLGAKNALIADKRHNNLPL